jgi:large subunit ribosomal protein L18
LFVEYLILHRKSFKKTNMEAAKKRILARQRNKTHVRKKIRGTQERPRVSVFRSAQHIYGQVIDDIKAETLLSVSSTEKKVKEKIKGFTGNKDAAKIAGKELGERLAAKGLKTVVFDRNGFVYHGRVKSFADGIREAGIEF